MMEVHPSRDEFLSGIDGGSISPLYIGPLKPSMGPADAYEAVRSGGYSFLLESARHHQKIGRYSYVGSEPYMVFSAKGNDVYVSKGGQRAVLGRRPLGKLRELMAGYKTARLDHLPPFTGGCVGFFSYDFVHNFEKLPGRAVDDLGIDDACFMFVDTVVAFDHVEDAIWLIASPGAAQRGLGYTLPQGRQWDEAYDKAAGRLRRLYDRLRSHRPKDKERTRGTGKLSADPLITADEYRGMVRRAKQYIAAGDIFQANLSQRLSAKTAGIKPWDVYRVLREVNPSPFAAFLDFPDVKIVSSSPERLVRVSGDIVDTRPIAGTRPRGADLRGDELMRAELLLNEKERAEHIMLIDLERNDLGRVCDYGSVHVDELMATEDYSHVIHIVSNVTGRLANGRDAFDVIRAAFPGGTITGVPKVRCMEIIDELEPVTRGPYTGSAGYISHTGDMDLNIIIRTFVMKDDMAHVQVGAGIVADSDPDREYHETLHKAEALIKTLERL
jgi:aminodeoxychorismate synthase component I